ncbi:hypothetical protein SDRG_06117 [Saprolegnia diclina VS20]|uniref:WRKY19-like zinc finger domain-containing protein n=1 Tax=Saprolegnia diclina (strain VS20) TaxID=1156394 RepID=T0S1U1_SAPDV|nr:hypothetical protein SDRG_06117 [Saprolegnia diclina VS20]EQC36682.1 hypothetical protein SDRG_06117 [Saprolegnia diclina VS20]|eukprot:XP_008610103.1 hypothetical protein SDRG_06117 [Saprolegnia diclina VS20]
MPALCALGSCIKFGKVHGLCLLHYRMQCIVQKATALRHASASCHAGYSSDETNSTSSRAEPRSLLPSTKPNSKNRKCKVDGCSSCARRYGLCSRHGGSKLCGVDGCSTPAQTGGRCRAHGGGTLCKANGCASFARFQGLCSVHSNGVRPHSNDRSFPPC